MLTDFIPYMSFNMVGSQITVFLICLCKSLRLRCSQGCLLLCHFFSVEYFSSPFGQSVPILIRLCWQNDRGEQQSWGPRSEKTKVNGEHHRRISCLKDKMFVTVWNYLRACWQQLMPIAGLSRDLRIYHWFNFALASAKLQQSRHMKL